MPSAGCGAKGHTAAQVPGQERWPKAAKGLVRLFRLSACSWIVMGLRCVERFPLFLCCWRCGGHGLQGLPSAVVPALCQVQGALGLSAQQVLPG